VLDLLPKRPPATITAEPTISHFKLRGDRISFFIGRGLGRNKTGMYFKGQVTGDTITGDVEIEVNPYYRYLYKDTETGPNGNFPWTAVRIKE
jgi:hypothetical protein